MRAPRRRSPPIPALALGLWLVAVLPASSAGGAGSVPRQRGVSWVAGGPVTRQDLEPLRRHNVDWIVQTPFGWQPRHDAPELFFSTSGDTLWGETDIGLETTARLARELGIHTLLKPHVWIHRSTAGKWRSDIAMSSESDWELWFAAYARFILHYARLAERTGMEALAVGTELHETVRQRPDDWRRLIAEVRAVYHGRLTYAANWWREYQEVPFWDDLDFIGIQAYFPLANHESPTLEELERGWQPWLDAIRRLQRRVGLPVVFTEIGYRSAPDAAVQPWRWPTLGDRLLVGADPESQRRAYEAFFTTFWQRDWFAGAYFWKWYPHLDPPRRPGVGIDFTPQGKPAAAVLRRWYGSDQADGRVAQ